MKSLFIKFIIAVASLALTALLLEAAIGHWKPQFTYDSILLGYDFGCFIPGTDYYLALKPNKDCLLKSNGDQFPPVHIKTNSLGMRNAEIQIPKPANTVRILIIGDSYTTGWGVTDSQSFVRQTEQILQGKFPGKTIELINAGLPGSGPSYYYLFLKNHLDLLRPDIVIIAPYLFNDVTDNIYNSVWTQVDNQGLPLKVDSKIIYVDSSGNFYPNLFPWWFKIPIIKHSHLFSLAATLFGYKQTFSDGNEHILSPQACYYKQGCQDLDSAKAKTKQLFAAMKLLTDAKQIPLAVAMIPSEVQFERKSRLKQGIFVPLLPQDRQYPYDYFGQFFASINTPTIELRQAFDGQTGPFYFAADDHWTPRGHQIAGAALAQFLTPYVESIR